MPFIGRGGSSPPPDTTDGSPDPAICVIGHTDDPSLLAVAPGASGTSALVPPITDYAARVLQARAAANTAPYASDYGVSLRLPELLPATPELPRCAHALAAVDDHGRTRPGSLLQALRWSADTGVAWRTVGNKAVLSASPDGLPLIDQQNRLCLPLALRRSLTLKPGSRVLLSISPGRLAVMSSTALDDLVGDLDD